MAIQLGAAGETTVVNALYDIDFEPIVPLLVGEEGKLAKFLMELGGEEDLMETFARWAYTEAIDSVDTLNGAVTSSAVTFTVTTIGKWEPNAVLMHATSGETGVVQSVNTTTSQVTLFQRSRGDIAAGAWSNGDEIVRLGTAYPAGSSVNTPRLQQETTTDNYAQIFWEPVEFDGTTLAINAKKGLHGGDFVARHRKLKFLQLMRDIDYAHIFGESANQDGRRTLGGIYNFVASTEQATIASLTETAFEQHLETKGLLHGADGKLAVTSLSVAGILNRYASGKIQTYVGEKKYGYDLREYIVPGGRLQVMPHYNFSAVTTFRGRMIIVDKTNVQRAVLRPLKLYSDIETGTKDTKMDAWLGEMSVKWGHPRHHSLIKGITVT